MTSREVIDRIFKDPNTKYELTEFENLGKPIDEILEISGEEISGGKEVGKTKYYLKSIIPFVSGKMKIQIYDSEGKSAPEEIVRQLWVYKLIHQYDYKPNEIDLEKSVQFGTEVGTKAADIIVYTDSSKDTPKIIIECKRPKGKDGIEQLKTYMNAKGAPVAVWSNGCDRIILYRPYPKEFDDTLFDIPKRGQEPKDVLEAKKTILQLRTDFNFKKIVQDLEELVLAESGKDEFNEIFKLIFAKIWDEKEAIENRKDKTVDFRKSIKPDITYQRINGLFKRASAEWPGVFKPNEEIELTKRHLQVCVGPIEGVRLLGSNLRIMDDAFEYLIPTEAKKKKGQFFTPRNVVEMCVRMLNPKQREYVLDPACGSGGFLLHTMDWCYPVNDNREREDRKHRYASKYLWGIDFEQRAAKISRALMLIAGDGHSKIYGPDVNSLDLKTWHETISGQSLMNELIRENLVKKAIPDNESFQDDAKAWEYFDELKFDLVLANPPFAGEVVDRKQLSHYDLAKNALIRAGNKQPKEERDVLFIERILKWLKPGGRAAIVLPQGKFNNSSFEFIREWIMNEARVLGVVSLHPNTFKPHTPTKTSVLLIQKHTLSQIKHIEKIKTEITSNCPSYVEIIQRILDSHHDKPEIYLDTLPDEVADLLIEYFPNEDIETNDDYEGNTEDDAIMDDTLASSFEAIQDTISDLKLQIVDRKTELIDIDHNITALMQKLDLDYEAQAKVIDKQDRERSNRLKDLKAEHRSLIKKHRAESTKTKKSIIKQIEYLQRQLCEVEYTAQVSTTRGQLEYILGNSELLEILQNKWINKALNDKLDYPIFMAVSEKGGKNNSGNYEYVINNGSICEFPQGHPQEGMPIVDQDLVNFSLTQSDFENVKGLKSKELCIAEKFVLFAVENKLEFWVGKK